MGGKQGSVGGRLGSAGARSGSQLTTPVKAKAAAKAPVRKGGAPAAAATRYTGGRGTDWDINGADWARGGGIFGTIGDVTWGEEAHLCYIFCARPIPACRNPDTFHSNSPRG